LPRDVLEQVDLQSYTNLACVVEKCNNVALKKKKREEKKNQTSSHTILSISTYHAASR
jgi:hypothetical protein